MNSTAPESPSDGAVRYAVIDLASVEEMWSTISKLEITDAEPLFSRKFAKEVQRVGPWLILVSNATSVERKLEALGPKTPWGFFINSSIDITSLRQSLRRFNIVKVPDDKRRGKQKEVLFRYWDPRVMKAFLGVADADQRGKLFRYIDSMEIFGQPYLPVT